MYIFFTATFSDDEKNTGDYKQSFELGTMFTAARKYNNKLVKKVTTQDHRIININKTFPREIKPQNKTTNTKSKKENEDLTEEYANIDSGCDTFGIGGKTWIIESKTDRKFSIKGYHDDTIKENIHIGTCRTSGMVG